MKAKVAPFNLIPLLCSFFFAWNCDLSDSRKQDTLTFHLDDSLLTVSGKYDSVRLDLYGIRGKDTVFEKVLFSGEYSDPSQLKKLPLGSHALGDFVVHVIAYRNNKKAWEVGVPFSGGKGGDVPIVYQAPEDGSPGAGNHAPAFVSGIENQSMMEGEVKRVVVRAKDEDNDAIQIGIKNLDSLMAIFGTGSGAIILNASSDSIVILFSPGSKTGNFRFQMAVTDIHSALEVQVFTISVGNVNRPPSVSLSGTGSTFLVKEGRSLKINVNANDPDSGDVVSLLPMESTPWGTCGQGSYDTASGEMTFSPSFHCVASGESTFSGLSFRARDNGSPSETGRIYASITVQDSNSAPKWTTDLKKLAGKEGIRMSLSWSPLFLGDDEQDSVVFESSCGVIDTVLRAWSFVPGFLEAGEKICEITARDSHVPSLGSKLTLSLSIADSSGALDVEITSPAAGFVSKDSLVVVRWKVGNRFQAFDTTERLEFEGSNVIRRIFMDSIGNSGRDSVIVFLDTKPPLEPRVSGKQASPTTVRKPEWSWKGGGGGIGIFRMSLDTEPGLLTALETADTMFTAKEDLNHGQHILHVQEKDSAGNWSSAAHAAIYIDIIPPDAPKMEAVPYSPLNTLKPTWKWRSSGGGVGIFRCKLDGVNLESVPEQADTTYTPSGSLLQGRHILYVQERDSAGNWSKVSGKELVLAIRGIHGSAGFSNPGTPNALSLAINKAGEKFVIYEQFEDTIHTVNVKKFNGSFWEPMENPSQYGSMDWVDGMAFDGNNVPYLCLKDSAGRATVVRHLNGAWSPLGNRMFTEGSAGEMALQFAPNGTPYVIFRDGAKSNKASVMRFNGSAWETVGGAGFSQGFSLFFSMVITKANIPYVGYLDAAADYGKPIIRRFSSSSDSWELVGDVGIHSPHADYFKLVADKNDSLFLAIPSTEGNGDALIFRYSGARWENFGDPIFKAEAGISLTLSVDSAGNKFAAYQDESDGYKVVVKALKGNAWISMAPPGFSYASSLLSPIALSPEGVPYVAFADFANGGKISVIQFSFDP